MQRTIRKITLIFILVRPNDTAVGRRGSDVPTSGWLALLFPRVPLGVGGAIGIRVVSRSGRFLGESQLELDGLDLTVRPGRKDVPQLVFDEFAAHKNPGIARVAE